MAIDPAVTLEHLGTRGCWRGDVAEPVDVLVRAVVLLEGRSVLINALDAVGAVGSLVLTQLLERGEALVINKKARESV